MWLWELALATWLWVLAISAHAAEELAEVARELGIYAGILLAIGVLWTKGVRPVVRIIRTLVRVSDHLDEIVKEFRPNHGHSLVDVTQRMDRNIRANARNNVTLYRMISSLPDTDPSLFAPLEELEDPPPRGEDE